MSVPTWVTGQVLASADVNNWFVPMAIVKPANTSRVSTTTLAADPDLALNLASGAYYEVDFGILFNGPNAAGYLATAFTANNGGIYTYTHTSGAIEGGATDSGYSNALAGIPCFQNGAANGPFWTSGTGNTWMVTGTGIAYGGTGAQLALTWAQYASSATAVTLLQHSYMTAHRIG